MWVVDIEQTFPKHYAFSHVRKRRPGKSEGDSLLLKDSKSIPLSTIPMIIHLREKAKEKVGGRGVWAEQQCEEKVGTEQTLGLLMWKEVERKKIKLKSQTVITVYQCPLSFPV